MYRRGGELLEVTTSQPRGGRGRVAGIVPADSVKGDKASYMIMFGDFVSASFYKQLQPFVRTKEEGRTSCPSSRVEEGEIVLKLGLPGRDEKSIQLVRKMLHRRRELFQF